MRIWEDDSFLVVAEDGDALRQVAGDGDSSAIVAHAPFYARCKSCEHEWSDPIVGQTFQHALRVRCPKCPASSMVPEKKENNR